MVIKRMLRPSNRAIRWAVGGLLVTMACLQLVETVPDEGTQVTVPTRVSRAAADTSDGLVGLARTDHIGLLERCLSNYDGLWRDYTCTLVKQERIDGTLGREQEIAVKFLDRPFSVAMRWLRNAPIADRVLYVEGIREGHMLARPKSGLLRLLTGGHVLRKPDGPEAMRNTLRPVSVFGFRRSLEALLGVYRQALAAGHLSQSFGGRAEVAGRRTLVLERSLPALHEYPAGTTRVYVDIEHLVPVCVEGFGWEDELLCRYTYKDVRLNVGLEADDFLPEANGMASAE